MASRWQRVMAFGPVVNYNTPESWTDEVRELYKRLENGDFRALAPLIACDIEFIADPQAIRALVGLKYDPDYRAAKARPILRQIANVLARRPRRKTKLPYGDLINAKLQSVAAWLESHRLLELKHDREALEMRLQELLRSSGQSPARSKSRSPSKSAGPAKDEVSRLVEQLCNNVQTGTSHVRSYRSWALGFVADQHNTSRKTIERRIERDEVVRATRKLIGRPAKGGR